MTPVRTQSREMLITSIKRVAADPASFVLPTTYHRNETTEVAQQQPQTKVTILSFDEGKTQ